MPRVPNFGKRYTHTNICAWDAVTAHLLLEKALDSTPAEAAGQAFLVTGKGPALSIGTIRETIKVRIYSLLLFIFAFSLTRSYKALLKSPADL